MRATSTESLPASSAGRPAGPTSPNHDEASKSGKPDSAMLGVSGNAAERPTLVTASTRSLPLRTCWIAEGIVANMKWICSPESRSFSATAPLYGTWVMSRLACRRISSPERWEEVPLPVEA